MSYCAVLCDDEDAENLFGILSIVAVAFPGTLLMRADIDTANGDDGLAVTVALSAATIGTTAIVVVAVKTAVWQPLSENGHVSLRDLYNIPSIRAVCLHALSIYMPDEDCGYVCLKSDATSEKTFAENQKRSIVAQEAFKRVMSTRRVTPPPAPDATVIPFRKRESS